jgi:glycosyltransferase involved in cell wall biosynthesis
MVAPISGIIPTYNRVNILKRTLDSIAQQTVQPKEIIIIDASDDNSTEELCKRIDLGLCEIIYLPATEKGAAAQRNQGVEKARYDYILFMDDDVILENLCLERLWNCIFTDTSIGGVNAMITNQKYVLPGKTTKFVLSLLSEVKLNSYAGKCVGPAWTFLPDDAESLPESNVVDWLNLGATIYRKNALPNPPFSSKFKGYSMMEDITLSLTVRKNYTLKNVRTARLYHDSQPGTYKRTYTISKMELMNRHYVMRNILEKKTFKDFIKLLIYEIFILTSICSKVKTVKDLPLIVAGKISGFYNILIYATKN